MIAGADPNRPLFGLRLLAGSFQLKCRIAPGSKGQVRGGWKFTENFLQTCAGRDHSGIGAVHQVVLFKWIGRQVVEGAGRKTLEPRIANNSLFRVLREDPLAAIRWTGIAADLSRERTTVDFTIARQLDAGPLEHRGQ